MPRLSVWFIRSSLIHLLLGFTWGGLMLFQKGFPLHPMIWRLFPSHIEFLLFGWISQIVIGMAFWILPRFSRHPKRGNTTLVWTTFWLLNLGIWSNVLASFSSGIGSIGIFGDFAKFMGIIFFAAHLWPRIK